MTRLRVAVLFGGRSAEHEVSCLSARSVIDALDPERIAVVPIGITREGRWHRLPGPPPLPAETGRLPEVTEGSGTAVELAGEAASSELVTADGSREPIDVVFPVLHGPAGEDGAVQGLLELAGVPYVGAGVLASAIGMHKDVQKRLFRDAGLPIGPYEAVHERDWADDPDAVEAAVEALGYPVFAKPATLGSSVGVTKVTERSGLAGALAEAFRYAREALVERAAEGARELECSVLGNDEPVASLAGEIVPEGHDFYDYAAKYLDERGARLLIPADVPAEVMAEVQRLAVAAFRAIRCAGMARVDFFLLPGGELWVNEVNTIPGFTSISMYPKLWEASGLPYPELVERLLELAIERHGAERRSTGVPELGGAAPDLRGGRPGR
jgi:D-alanine-D-alanine ligase